MSKPWGGAGAGAGAWALEVERSEAEELEQAAIAGAAPQSFPSLKESMAAKPKKKKAVSISLAQFTTGAYTAPGPAGGRHTSEPKGLTPDEMLRLPTGPRDRTPEELEHRGLGGGFRSYGPRGGEGDGQWAGGGGRRPYGGGFDDDQRRGPARGPDPELQSSRADDADNWAVGKKSFIPMEGRGDRYSSLSSRAESRADDVDNWAVGKKAAPSRSTGFGSGFRDSSGPSDSDRWARGSGAPSSLQPSNQPSNGDRERPRLVLDPRKDDVSSRPKEPAASTHSNPFGAARPREEVLAEKGLDWRKIDSDIILKKTSRPTSSHSSRPSSAHSSRPDSPGKQVAGAEGAPPTRQKVNPFGDAKPREVLLQERGKDWRKIDSELEHRRFERQETDEERLLKEEVNHLKKALTGGTMSNLDDHSEQISEESVVNLRKQLIERETQLEQLSRELDNKVRFGQKAAGDSRPGSGAGRTGTVTSYRGISEDSRSTDFMERPRSRGGIGDASAKPLDDRRGFRGARESSFFGSRDMERSKSRERW